jgi:ribosome-binding protein aMBF1 (putative translation factor)
MIRNDKEYQEAVKRLKADQKIMDEQKRQLASEGLTDEQIQRGIEPLLSFHQQLVEEVEWYERIKRGDIGTILSITDLGKCLIALRIASGMSQKELAERLGVKESQVSRDERNEYFGITLQRAQKIVDAIQGSRVVIKIEYDGSNSESDLIAV